MAWYVVADDKPGEFPDNDMVGGLLAATRLFSANYR
jgi:hypothetical protein